MFLTSELFDLTLVPETLQPLLSPTYPMDILTALDQFLSELTPAHLGEVHPSAIISGAVFIAPGARVGPFALVEGPAWIGEGAEIGHGAYVRGGCVLGPRAKVGHSSEVKRSLLLAEAKAPHFNYVGDSVIGTRVNLGAGVKLANFHTLGKPIKINQHDTTLRKLGAMLGDDVSIGCNAVLAPGTIVGPRSILYSGVNVRGVIGTDQIFKPRQELVQTPRISPL